MAGISLLKILKNGFSLVSCIGVIAFSTLLLIISITFFKDFSLIFATLTILFFSVLYIIIKFIILTIKIGYFFNNGIEAEAVITDYTYTYAGSWKTYFAKEMKNILFFRQNDRDNEMVNGVIYQYYINNEIYESKAIIYGNINLKKGDRINILVNPKNKNDAIIKDNFIND
jgi:hypothetical protein